jgi:hypothetical protein
MRYSGLWQGGRVFSRKSGTMRQMENDFSQDGNLNQKVGNVLADGK